MIQPASPTTPSDVARFYDDHDFFYRHIWGDHVHHGLWNDRDDRSTVKQATDRLLYLTTKPLRLLPGQRVADIGCGYGASSTWLAESFGTEVLGLTLSGIQTNVARSRPTTSRGKVRIEARDWLDNDLDDASLDAAIAIESLAHMPDKPRFFQELHRTLKPGGKAGLACWIANPNASSFESFLLRKICAKGRLAGIGTIAQYEAFATDAGLKVLGQQEVTKHVERTWRIIARRALAGLFTNGKFLRFALRRAFHDPFSVFALPQLLVAYRSHALRYHFLWVEKPDQEAPPSETPSETPSEEPFEMPPFEPSRPPTKRSGVHRGIGALVNPAPLQVAPSKSTPSAIESNRDEPN